MNIKLMVFKGASIYCQSAAAVIEIPATFEVSRFLPELKSRLDLNRKILESSRTQFTFPGEGSSRIDEMQLFAGSWASLCAAADCDVFLFGGKRIFDRNYLFVSCTDNEIGKYCVTCLVQMIGVAAKESQFLHEYIEKFLVTLKPHAPPAGTKYLIASAKDFGIPMQKIFNPNMMVFGSGRNSIIFNRQSPGDDSHHGTLISRDKQKSKMLFMKLGVPVASSVVIDSPDSLGKALGRVTFPCVVKPIDGSQGSGVYVNLKNEADVVRAVRKSSQLTRMPLLIEQQIAGDHVRLLICRGELLIAVKTLKPSVLGNGIDTIRQLVQHENACRDEKNVDKTLAERKSFRILIDDEASDYLLTQGYTLEYVPKAGEIIEVRGASHGRNGGTMFDVTAEIHPEIVSLAILASERIGGALCGLDYLSSDHSKSPSLTGGVFLEINTFPGLLSLNFLSSIDRRRSLQKIFGKAATPCEVCIFISKTPIDLVKLKSSVFGSHTAWYCSRATGFGYPKSQWIRSNVPVEAAFERLMLDSRADRLVFFLTVDEFVLYGLPSDIVASVTVVDSEMISSEVRDALKLSADVYNEVSFSSLCET